MTATYKKALLASAILLALSGADVFAEAPQMTGSQNGMSQSSMIDVKSGKEAGKTGEISDQTEKAEPSMEVKESHQTVAVGDASLYLSADDDAAIEAHTGKTIAHVDFDGIPEEVKTKLSPLLQSKPGSTVSIIADSALRVDDIDEKKVEEAKQKAEIAMQEYREGKQKLSEEEYATLAGQLAKTLAELKVARRKKG